MIIVIFFKPFTEKDCFSEEVIILRESFAFSVNCYYLLLCANFYL